jgi:hypothetical protein
MSYISGEIHSGEQFRTEETPTALRPEIFSISLTPNPVVRSSSLFIQVFVRDVPMPIE